MPDSMPLTLLAAGPEALGGYLWVAAGLFAAGLGACLARRNAFGVLIGVELMLNAAALQFVAFSRFRPLDQPTDGQVAALFVIVLAAAEAAVALALLFAFARRRGDVDLDQATELSG